MLCINLSIGAKVLISRSQKQCCFFLRPAQYFFQDASALQNLMAVRQCEFTRLKWIASRRTDPQYNPVRIVARTYGFREFDAPTRSSVGTVFPTPTMLGAFLFKDH